MERDWVRLGRYVKAARRARPGLTQPKLGELVGVKRATIQNIEGGHAFVKVGPTLRAIERELGWAEGSIERVLAGREPLPAGETPPEEQTPDAEAGPAEASRGLPLRILHELDKGDLIDTQVLDLGTNRSGGRMIVVVRGEPGAPDEELAEDMERWARALPELRRLILEEGGNTEAG